jgi:hypothetical protein
MQLSAAALTEHRQCEQQPDEIERRSHNDRRESHDSNGNGTSGRQAPLFEQFESLLFTNCKHSDDKFRRHVVETSSQIVAEDLGNRSNDRELQAFRHRGGFGGKQALVPQGVRAPFCVWPIPWMSLPRQCCHSKQLLQFSVPVQMRFSLVIGAPCSHDRRSHPSSDPQAP